MLYYFCIASHINNYRTLSFSALQKQCRCDGIIVYCPAATSVDCTPEGKCLTQVQKDALTYPPPTEDEGLVGDAMPAYNGGKG